MSNTFAGLPNNPAFKSLVETFRKEHFIKLEEAQQSYNTDYLYKLTDACTLLKNGPLKWKFYLPSQISLGIIHLRENQRHSQINRAFLRDLIIEWQTTAKSEKSASSGQWYQALKTPENKKLLALR